MEMMLANGLMLMRLCVRLSGERLEAEQARLLKALEQLSAEIDENNSELEVLALRLQYDEQR
jgi:hypothetical protein